VAVERVAALNRKVRTKKKENAMRKTGLAAWALSPLDPRTSGATEREEEGGTEREKKTSGFPSLPSPKG